MISPHSRTDEWINSVRGRGSRELTEKMVLAFTLVEMLQQSGLPFVFKGGTSLSLITGTLKRFSIDVDIVCEPGQLLDSFFQSILRQGVFTRFEEDKRKNDPPIITHYKFYYPSLYPSSIEREHHILLDVLFETTLYATLLPYPIKSPILETERTFTHVLCPSVEGLCGDKLTAFAPHTTGKHFFNRMEIEILKQLHDVAVLFDLLTTNSDFFQTFDAIASADLKYRNLEMLTSKDVALDNFNTSFMIGLRGKTGNEDNLQEFGEVCRGIAKLDSYIYEGRSNQEIAILNASKGAYLSALLLNQSKDFKRFTVDKIDQMRTWFFDDPLFAQLNPLRKTNMEAFYYFYQASRLVKEGQS